MIKCYKDGVYCVGGRPLVDDNNLETINSQTGLAVKPSDLNESAKDNTLAWSVLKEHNVSGNDDYLNIKFDAMASHDITYVGIVQTARASGLTEFPLPYVLTCCHNSLCAVGGTINEDDHVFGLSAAKKYGGIFVPPHQAVIHQYMREMFAGCGRMILGSDSHTRYGALGCMGVGEGGPELVKQLLKRTWDAPRPQVVGVYLSGEPKAGVGPQDVALALIGETFKSGFVKNCVLEFFGPGVENLSVDYRLGIDVMTTETTCLSSIWTTDDKVADYLRVHGREGDYKAMELKDVVYYDKLVAIELDKVVPLMALPFHPSNVYTITDVMANAKDIFGKVEADAKAQFASAGVALDLMPYITDEGIKVQQGIVAGCSGGTYENIELISHMMENTSVGSDEFTMSVYPASQPVYSALMQSGAASRLLDTGTVMKTAFCGPCFGAGDVPRNNGLSIRHTTRNFPNREGSKPGDGQLSAVALMDARSIAATAMNGGILTPADQVHVPASETCYSFNPKIYENRVYQGAMQPVDADLIFGPNIKDWPTMIPMTDDLMLVAASVIHDEVTTTDELIPSGDTSSYRSNPLKLSEFTLSRKDPAYVPSAKASQVEENLRREGTAINDAALKSAMKALGLGDDALASMSIGSFVYANKPGDGSAREQAASCQKVLGGWANIAKQYATKRYRSNLINWGMLPFVFEGEDVKLERGDVLYLQGIKKVLEDGSDAITAKVVSGDSVRELSLKLPDLTKGEREILLAGCLMNYYQQQG